jgi:hypothetical protein
MIVVIVERVRPDPLIEEYPTDVDNPDSYSNWILISYPSAEIF